MSRISVVALTALLCGAAPAAAQETHDHSPTSDRSTTRVTQAGEAAYGALSEVVRILEADPKTDWSRVDLETLRRHLADMHAVTVNASVTQTDVPGGFDAEVTGDGQTAAAIRRMARAHARASAADERHEVTVTDLPNGARVRLVARTEDTQAVHRLRGLGFIGWLALGDHHGPHHLMIARGTTGSSGH